MSMLKFLLLVLSVTIFLHEKAFANEAAEEHSEPQQEEASHGEGKKEDKGLAPWVEIENKITELNSRIQSKDRAIREAIEYKNTLPDNSTQVKALVNQIVKDHKDLENLVEEREKKITQLKYRYPERHAKEAKRTYDRIEVKSVEEMEQAVGIDGKLNRSLSKMRSQFKSDSKAVASPEASAQKKKDVQKVLPQQQSIEEADSVILEK